MKKARLIVPTKKQEKELKRLRRILAEKGYVIFSLHKRLRMSKQDFSACPKEKTQRSHALFVMAAKENKISIQPYANMGMESKLKAMLEAPIDDEVQIYWKKQPLLRQKNLTVEHFLSPAGRKELELLTLK